MGKVPERVFCAFCKAERKLTFVQRLGFLHYFSGAAFALAISYVVWQAPRAEGLIVFALICIVAEVFVALRRRLSLVCQDCGFDPALYIRDPERACEQVKSKLNRIREAADKAPLRSNPLHRLAKVVGKPEDRTKTMM